MAISNKLLILQFNKIKRFSFNLCAGIYVIPAHKFQKNKKRVVWKVGGFKCNLELKLTMVSKISSSALMIVNVLTIIKNWNKIHVSHEKRDLNVFAICF